MRALNVRREHTLHSVEQQSFPGDRLRADAAYDPTGRKLHAFSLIRRLEARGIDVILLPCFISQTFLGELSPNIGTPIFGLMDALRAKLATDLPTISRIGVLTSDYVRSKDLFGRVFQGTHTVVYPDDGSQHDLMEAVYAVGGIIRQHPPLPTLGDLVALLGVSFDAWRLRRINAGLQRAISRGDAPAVARWVSRGERALTNFESQTKRYSLAAR